MATSTYLIEVTTVGGARLTLGPYGRLEAEHLATEFRTRIGSDDMTLVPGIDAQGLPAGTWALSGRGIAGVAVRPCAPAASRTSVRLAGRNWSRPFLG